MPPTPGASMPAKPAAPLDLAPILSRQRGVARLAQVAADRDALVLEVVRLREVLRDLVEAANPHGGLMYAIPSVAVCEAAHVALPEADHA